MVRKVPREKRLTITITRSRVKSNNQRDRLWSVTSIQSRYKRAKLEIYNKITYVRKNTMLTLMVS